MARATDSMVHGDMERLPYWERRLIATLILHEGIGGLMRYKSIGRKRAKALVRWAREIRLMQSVRS